MPEKNSTSLGNPTGSIEQADEKPSRAWMLLLLGGFLAVLVFSFAIDEKAFSYIHDHWNYNTRPVPDYLKLPTRIMRAPWRIGAKTFTSSVSSTPCGISIRHRRSRIVLLIVSALLVTIPVEGIKRIVGRERPEWNGGKSVFHGPMKMLKGRLPVLPVRACRFVRVLQRITRRLLSPDETGGHRLSGGLCRQSCLEGKAFFERLLAGRDGLLDRLYPAATAMGETTL